MQERRSWSSEEKTRALLSPCLPHYYSVQSHINSVTFFTSSPLHIYRSFWRSTNPPLLSFASEL